MIHCWILSLLCQSLHGAYIKFLGVHVLLPGLQYFQGIYMNLLCGLLVIITKTRRELWGRGVACKLHDRSVSFCDKMVEHQVLLPCKFVQFVHINVCGEHLASCYAQRTFNAFFILQMPQVQYSMHGKMMISLYPLHGGELTSGSPEIFWPNWSVFSQSKNVTNLDWTLTVSRL